MNPGEIVPLEIDNPQGPHLHSNAREDFLRLRQEARSENLELSVASGYRDYSRQRDIWNGKVSGRIPLRNEQGEIIPTEQLSETERILTILRWSALPGFSRHHWGSDLDVFDANACPRPQLLPQEYLQGGACHPLFLFLCKKMKQFGFFHPYDKDRGGICPEPWHISHYPTAAPCETQLSVEGLKHFITLHRKEILLADIILSQADIIFERFIDSRGPTPPEQSDRDKKRPIPT